MFIEQFSSFILNKEMEYIILIDLLTQNEEIEIQKYVPSFP